LPWWLLAELNDQWLFHCEYRVMSEVPVTILKQVSDDVLVPWAERAK
jgi:hypothetical protein